MASKRVSVASFRLLPNFRSRTLQFEVAILDRNNKEFYILRGSTSKLITKAGLQVVKDWVADVALTIYNARGQISMDILSDVLDRIEDFGQKEARRFIKTFQYFCSEFEQFLEEPIDDLDSSEYSDCDVCMELLFKKLKEYKSVRTEEEKEKIIEEINQLAKKIIRTEKWGLPPICKQNLDNLN